MENQYEALWKTAGVMAPDGYPRRVGFVPEGGGPDDFQQKTVASKFELVDQIDSIPKESPKYISVYGFPRGHTTAGYPPEVDTVFLDFDIPSGHIYHLTKDESDWKNAINALLEPLREVAWSLYTNGMSDYWRVVLSGHKGIHLYLDFPAVESETASVAHFRRGLQQFVQQTTDRLEGHTHLSLEEFTDADSADLARLCRFPNTIHEDATRNFGEDRYCVPVEMDELIGMDAERYAELTRSPRLPASWDRTESDKAREFVRQNIFHAIKMGDDVESNARYAVGGQFNKDRVDRYRRENQDKFERIEEIWWLLQDKPCIREYYNRDDQFRYSQQSHLFELFVMTHLLKIGVPYDLIVEFFRDMEGFDEAETTFRLNQLIGRGYHLDSESGSTAPIKCETVWAQAPEFCVNDDCRTYRLHAD